MVEDYCSFNKEGLKTPKKSHIALRMFTLSAVMVCGIYICSICLKQLGYQNRPRIMKIGITESCRVPNLLLSEIPYLHFPEPVTFAREECKCTPVRFFAILSMQRSGSGWFETLLNSHINVSSNGEIFSVKERKANLSSIVRVLDQVYNLDWYSSAAKNECTAAVGLKWMLNQGLMEYHEEISKYFARRGVSLIFLFRRNLLRRLVSQLANDHDRSMKQLNGKHKAHVHSVDEANILAKYKPSINASELISNFKYTHKSATDALKYFKNNRYAVFYYEDLIRNQTKLMDVLNFIGAPPQKLASRHIKIHTRPLPEQILNWNEVYKTLQGTQYESFLSADYNL